MIINYLSLILFFSSAINFFIAVLAARKLNSTISVIFFILMVSLALYSAGYGFEIMHRDIYHKLFWVKIEYIGISFIPTTWLIFTILYSGMEKLFKKPLLISLFSISGLTLLLKMTDGTHNLIYRTSKTVEAHGLSILAFTPGTWYYIFSFYMVACLIGGLLILSIQLSKSCQPYRNHIKIIIAGAVIPITAYFSRLIFFYENSIDIIPFAFTLTGLLSFIGMTRMKLFDLMPIARSNIIENIRDGFLVIDSRSRIADVNTALLKMLRIQREQIVGHNFQKVLKDFPGLREVCEETEIEKKLQIDKNRFVKARITSIFNDEKNPLGKLALLQDITEQAFAEKEIENNARFRELLVDMATNFINIPLEKTDFAINKALSAAGFFARADRIYIFRYDHEKKLIHNTHEWYAEGIASQKDNLQNIPFDSAPGFILTHKQGKVLYIPDVKKMPEESSERKILEEQGIKTLITFPMMDGDKCIGFTGLDLVKQSKEFTEDQIDLLKVLTEIFTNAEMRKEKEQKLKESEGRYNLFFEHAPLGVIHIDKESTIVNANKKFASIIDADREQIIGINILKQLNGKNIQKFVLDTLKGKGAQYEGFYKSMLTGKTTYIKALGKSILDGKENIGAIIIFEDISERKKIEEQLRHDALHDPLTGLANRALLKDRIERAVLHFNRKPSDIFVLMFLDLDDFKKVNDSLGHTEGDNLLKEVAKRIAQCIRPEDTLARLGGDEFAILLELLPENALSAHVGQRILSSLSEPFSLSGHKVSTTASIGICSCSEDIKTPEAYLRNADMAMYKAKREGKNRLAYFRPEMYESSIKKLTEETYLWEAVRNKNLMLHYQPIVELQTEKIVAYEALIRWNHPEKGLLFPKDFIPLAEETGLIVSMGEWIMEEACNRKWLDKELSGEGLKLHVNISARQLYSHDIISKLEEVLVKTGFNAKNLCLEITESILMSKDMSDVLKRIKDMGINLYIDDFGTGFSSLSYLHHHPIDGIKIDRAFISKMLFSREEKEIVKTIIALAKSLEMPVIAEGVETRKEAEYLKETGCKYGQGFLWGYPSEKDFG